MSAIPEVKCSVIERRAHGEENAGEFKAVYKSGLRALRDMNSCQAEMQKREAVATRDELQWKELLKKRSTKQRLSRNAKNNKNLFIQQ